VVLVPDVVRRKLLEIQSHRTAPVLDAVSLGRLEQKLQLQWAVERGLQLAAEALFDAGNHILAGAFQETVDEYREIPRQLAARGVLQAETAARLESLAGFRNVLVHDYTDVDLSRVHAGLERLADLRRLCGRRGPLA
jgi:uncharacterized protein YutE (UPF0331/DUF86 family)